MQKPNYQKNCAMHNLKGKLNLLTRMFRSKWQCFSFYAAGNATGNFSRKFP